MHVFFKICLPVLVLSFFHLSVQSQNTSSPVTPAPNAKINYTLFLVGETDNTGTGQTTTLTNLQQQLPAAGKESKAIFIGNTFNPRKFPKEESASRAAAETALKQQLDPFKNYASQMLIIPGGYGNKDKEIKDYRRQENFIAEYLQNDKIFQPESGCPGPVELHINDDLLLLMVDTKWLLPSSEIEEGSGCTALKPSQVVGLIDDILRNYSEKQVVFAVHIPEYIKPIEYRYLRRNLAAFYKQHPGLIYVESNGSALRHSFADSINYISTGTLSPSLKTAKNDKILFENKSAGFAKVNFYDNGESWLEFWTQSSSQPVYRALLMRKATLAMLTASLKGKTFNFTDSIVEVRASNDYKATNFREWLLGENYRAEWAQPVKLPVFDIGKIKGGLKVTQQGGGFQTKSLRLQAANGKEYVLRSVEKYPANALPRALRKTIAADVVKDQISASHPYAPMVITSLSKTADIYHTNPQFFYIPDDPRFGKYREGFANTVGLFEERPDDDQSDLPNFGNSKKVTSTEKMLENLREDNDNSVDQKSVVRARLFDFFIGDWDRHDDQWRWASFNKKDADGKFYRPIPRDRDMAFFVNQGVIPNIGSRKWLVPKFQGFDGDIRDIHGFNFNGRYFDRAFLTSLTLADWLEVANDLKQALTDAEIEKAIKIFPQPIYQLSGEEIITKLKARRDDLPEDAADYYKFLAKEVNVVGSDKDELFEVVRLDDETTNVIVRKINKDKKLEQVLYQRQFKTSETREIRLYGLDGEDEFKITGQVKDGIKVRVVGGDDKDKITDESSVSGFRKKTFIYDTTEGNELNLGSESKNLTSNAQDINDYNRKEFVYDYTGPLGAVEYNRDNGILIGAGFALRTQGFKKTPFAVSHRVLAKYALLTKSFEFNYQGYFTHIVRKFDLQVNLDLRGPNYNATFFGLGNETTFNPETATGEDNIPFYRYTSRQYYVNALVGRKIGKSHVLLVGPSYQSVDINVTPNRFISDFANTNPDNRDLFEKKTYGGLEFRYNLNTVDNLIMPSKGFAAELGTGLYKGLTGNSSDFNRVFGSFNVYRTFRIPLRLTIANRVGGAKNYGDYEFFQANRLNGLTNLRGYRFNRFAGGSSFYNNTDVRIKLLTFQTYLFPGSLGILGFHDVGRVWENGQKSTTWHRGYGGGIWISPINMVVLSAEYAISKENRLPLLRAGFLF